MGRRNTPTTPAAPAVPTPAAPAAAPVRSRSRGKAAPAAPVAVPAAPIVPAVTSALVTPDASALALLALVTPDGTLDAEKLVATVRPWSRSTREKVTVALSSHAATRGAAVVAVLAVLSTAPTGRDPVEQVRDALRSATLTYAATVAAVVADASLSGALDALPAGLLDALRPLTLDAPAVERGAAVLARWRTMTGAGASDGTRTRSTVERPTASACVGVTFTTPAGHAVACDALDCWRVVSAPVRPVITAGVESAGPRTYATATAAVTACDGIGRDAFAVNGWKALKAADGRTAHAMSGAA